MRLSTAQCTSTPMNQIEWDPIAIAMAEDIGPGDVTTDVFVPETLRGSARIVAREKAIVAWSATAAGAFRRVDSSVHVEIIGADGAEINTGESVLEIRGLARSILSAERCALNFLQH